MENQIIIIYPYRFREFDRNRFEVEYLKRYTNVVIHELIDTLHQHFSAAYHEVDRTNDVIRFSTLLGWRKEYLNNMKHFKGKTFVLNFLWKKSLRFSYTETSQRNICCHVGSSVCVGST